MTTDTSRLKDLNPSMPEYWSILTEPAGSVWPDVDPRASVTTLDPRPTDAPAEPKAVKDLHALARLFGMETRIGYSRACPRGQRLGTYRPTETFSVWFDPSREYRPFATYTRFRDAGEILLYDGRNNSIKPEPDTAKGKPGPWKWHVSISGRGTWVEVSITVLKEFIELRGLVVPAWLESKKKTATKSTEVENV